MIDVAANATGYLRWAAVDALGRIGPPARAAVGLLTKLANQEKSWVAQYASRALRKIQADPKRRP